MEKQANIYTKLFEIQKRKLEFKKTATNPFHKSNYCPLPEVWNTLEPVLEELQLLCIHEVKEWILKTTIVDMENIGEMTDRISTEIHINSVEAQKTGSDITYYKRYNLGCIFNIITDEDIDGNKWQQKKEKEFFTAKRLESMKKWALWKKKEEIMQYVLKIKKDYQLSAEMKEELDLYLSTIA